MYFTIFGGGNIFKNFLNLENEMEIIKCLISSSFFNLYFCGTKKVVCDSVTSDICSINHFRTKYYNI
jgi:hypothetical protein